MAHRLRSAVRAAEAGEALAPLSLEPCRRDPHAARADAGEPRRRAPRHRGVVERAAILYRGKPALVGVANVSRDGVTLQTSLLPEVGERLSVALEGAPIRSGAVRWVRGGRIGVGLDPQ